jgi:hypothetical protein
MDDAAPSYSSPLVFQTRLRWRVLGIVGALPLIVLVVLDIAEKGIWRATTSVNLVMAIFFVALTSAQWLRSSLHLTEEGVLLKRPLRRDQTIRYDEVEKIHVTLSGSGVWLFAEGDHDPTVAFDRSLFENETAFLAALARRVPDSAEVVDPKGRLDEACAAAR